jgi:NADPH:quinone reductase-like Zn-dependent oxidoreductase
MIDDPANLDIASIKLKALSFSWEFMFARSMFQADDMDAQGKLLNRVADLVDQGKLVTTANKHAGAINEANLRAALEMQQSGTAIGKIVLEGFE